MLFFLQCYRNIQENGQGNGLLFDLAVGSWKFVEELEQWNVGK